MASSLHTHTSALTAAQIFLMVLILGTAWRLVAAEAVAPGRSPMVQEIGRNMAVQY